ncbi:Distantly related to plant expansins [Trametes cinnabarina]|uniref:Distantly related to plant expansins n=1 Tax=Pycnoporus cinnabarinus TaxID=5643 RepID=A0A060S581_PYCCI|nr:Distantly related to plant expansins [Trametes cinnabarina]
MHFLSFASLALAVSGVSAIAIPRNHLHVARSDSQVSCPPKPDTYYEGYLEDYCVYHGRYMLLDCESQHNTPFFDACCHPMLATETLEKNRAPQCNPANHVSSSVSSVSHTATSSSAHPASTQNLSTTGDDDDGDCDDEEPTSTASSAAPTATDDEDEDCDADDDEHTSTASAAAAATPTADDDDEDCDDENDEPSSSAPVVHTTSLATSTQAPVKISSSTPVATSSSHSITSSSHSTTSTHTATPTHSATPTKASPSPSKSTTPASKPTGSSDNDSFSGNATFFYQGGRAGACGKVHADSDFVAAMQTKRYGDLSAESPLCGKQVKITNTKNNKSVTVTIADACPTCGGENDIDLSEGAFTQIATIPEGEVPISWEFL